MKLILLSGGSGKRLWPMSNDSRSKQFLRILDGPDGTKISMLQRVWQQLGRVGLQAHTYVCASKAQRDVIESQIGSVPFIEEPERRDTFPAVALASLYLIDKEMRPLIEPVVVVPIDHFVDDEYFYEITRLGKILGDSRAELILMGVKPTEPSCKYGYIQHDDVTGSNEWYPVHSFTEKPGKQEATALIQEGALWNCGVFGFRLGYMRDLLTNNSYPPSYAEARKNFAIFPKRSFDYEVIENAESVVVHPYSGTWQDLGTWDALAGQLNTVVIGKGKTVECENTHIINELGIPLVGIGLKDAMVVATPDGILVTDKAMSANAKDAIGGVAGRPMYEERRWGMYKVLDYQKLSNGSEVLTKWIELQPGHHISYQKHAKRSEIWTIVGGSGQMVIDQKVTDVTAGTVIQIEQGQWHAIRANEDGLNFVEVQRGSELVEEDIIRQLDTWDKVMKHVKIGMLAQVKLV